MAFGKHDLSPSELAASLAAQREGVAFLAYRDADGSLLFHQLVDATYLTVGRAAEADIALEWDPQVSRAHAELRLVGADWTVSDDGLSRNGSFVNETRIAGRRRLADGDVLRFGNTTVLYRAGGEGAAETAAATGMAAAIKLTTAQRRVLVALCRPLADPGAVGGPATNQEIANELYLSIDGVRTHMRALFEILGVEDLPRTTKRIELARRALAMGIVNRRELQAPGAGGLDR